MKLISSFLILILALSLACNRKKVAYQNSINNLDTIESIADVLLFDNDTIAIYRIDSLVFFKEKKGAVLSTADTLVYTSDLAEAKKMLKGRAVFGGYNTETRLIDSSINEGMIYKINFSNGQQVFGNDQEYWDVGFWKYYPTEDILLCEGGHSSDFSFDLTNGIIGADSVGNPAYINFSPSRKYRLNGWFPGQECSDYFLQSKAENGYQYFALIPMDLTKEAFDLCTIKDAFWTDDHTLYFRNQYHGITEDKRLGFFRLLIKK